jgi:hypothetical protein
MEAGPEVSDAGNPLGVSWRIGKAGIAGVCPAAIVIYEWVSKQLGRGGTDLELRLDANPCRRSSAEVT